MCFYISRLLSLVKYISDSWFCVPNSKGIFNIKVLYRCLILKRSPTNYSLIWKKFWYLKIHERIKVFCWRLIFD